MLCTPPAAAPCDCATASLPLRAGRGYPKPPCPAAHTHTHTHTPCAGAWPSTHRTRLCAELRKSLDLFERECSSVFGEAEAAAVPEEEANAPKLQPASGGRKVFLSYARGLKTTAFARWIKQQLTAGGYSVCAVVKPSQAAHQSAATAAACRAVLEPSRARCAYPSVRGRGAGRRHRWPAQAWLCGASCCRTRQPARASPPGRACRDRGDAMGHRPFHAADVILDISAKSFSTMM